MTDADFGMDTALREMLRERAQDITSVPAHLVDLDIPREPTRTRPNYWLIAAAVVAVLAVAAGITALAQRHIASAPAKPVPVTNLPGCKATLPRAWIQATRHPSRASGWAVLDVATDGTALVARTDPSEVELDSLTSHRAVPLAIPAGLRLESGAFTGSYAVIGLGSGIQLERIDIVDVATRRTVRSVRVGSGDGSISQQLAVSDGRVYWDERDSGRAKDGVIRSYDIATGSRQVVYSGRYTAPGASAGGVYWSDPNGQVRIRIAASHLPSAVRDATTPISGVTLATDGTRYAWYDAAHRRIGWSDGSEVRYVSTPRLPVTHHVPAGIAVAGPYVFFADNSRYYGGVVDMRTGAVADLSGPGVTHGGTIDTLHPGPVVSGGGATIAVGGTVTPVGDPTGKVQVLQFDTAALPELHC
jgi:hypothetical protein